MEAVGPVLRASVKGVPSAVGNGNVGNARKTAGTRRVVVDEERGGLFVQQTQNELAELARGEQIQHADVPILNHILLLSKRHTTLYPYGSGTVLGSPCALIFADSTGKRMLLPMDPACPAIVLILVLPYVGTAWLLVNLTAYSFMRGCAIWSHSMHNTSI
ncbi:hypothetical protein B0H13DRAFT_1873179 [Mycena leptocephala]|nr:hypothetical protein B0H13DRAFT_1873179 [Mycena leptocephala]